jgi:hypothetical protein
MYLLIRQKHGFSGSFHRNEKSLEGKVIFTHREISFYDVVHKYKIFYIVFYVISCLESTILFDILIPPIRA